MQPQTQWFADRCIACQTCVETCPNGCLSMTPAGLQIDLASCEACGKCAQACPTGARELLGRDMTVEQVLVELLKDRAYYKKSGGGVTLSGGEPTFQPDFAETLLRTLKEHGISTALDTCGMCSTDTLERLLPYTDLVLFDLKVLDPPAHRQYTGASNQQILKNLDYLEEELPRRYPATRLWVRTPLIPGATSTDDNLSAIGSHLASHLAGTLTRWELCAFNNLCRDQYTRLGLQWEFASTPLMTPAELAHCEEVAKASGLSADLVLATGATRLVD